MVDVMHVPVDRVVEHVGGLVEEATHAPARVVGGWCGVVWSRVGVVWCGLVWCGVEQGWCGVVWCGEVRGKVGRSDNRGCWEG